MTIDPTIFKSYDIRGIYPNQINEENVSVIAQAILKLFQDKLSKSSPHIAIGHDMRLSASSLYPKVRQALVDGGADVVDFDLVATPTFYFSVIHFNLDAGILLSASHNPPKYNGFKIVINDNGKINKIGVGTGMEEIKNIALAGQSLHIEGGKVTQNTQGVEEELKLVESLFNLSQIKNLKIVADAGNAMGATYMSGFFEKINCSVTKINFELDGNFPAHDPNPLIEENIKELKERVLSEKADIGIATDGDGDRLIFVTEKGEMVSGATITALIAKELLSKNSGETIIYNITQTMTPEAIVAENGGVGKVVPVGHANLTTSMHKENGLFAGEVTGHYFYRETGGAESGLLTLAYLLLILSVSGKTLSQLVSEATRSYTSGELNYEVSDATSIMQAVKEKYREGKLLEIDGIAIDFPDWRLSLRRSNTEPLLRLCVEAKTKEMMVAHRDEIVAYLESAGATLHQG